MPGACAAELGPVLRAIRGHFATGIALAASTVSSAVLGCAIPTSRMVLQVRTFRLTALQGCATFKSRSTTLPHAHPGQTGPAATLGAGLDQGWFRGRVFYGLAQERCRGKSPTLFVLDTYVLVHLADFFYNLDYSPCQITDNCCFGSYITVLSIVSIRV